MSRFKNEGVLWLAVIFVSLCLLVNHHLGYSLGDSLLQAIGIPPWIGSDRQKLHVSAITLILVFLFAAVMAVRYYRPTVPRIISRIAIACIAFGIVFPYATEKVIVLVKLNSTSSDSIDYLNDSKCTFSQLSPDRMQANCSLTLFNYGKVESVTITPTVVFQDAIVPDLKFQGKEFHNLLTPHQKTSISVTFESEPLVGPEVVRLVLERPREVVFQVEPI